jgi:hypothetical protein
VGGKSHPLHWDLRNSHRAADLGVKLNPHSGHDFNNPGPVDIDLPGGQRFQADKMMLIVAVTGDDTENVGELVCWYPELSLDDAYGKALALTRQFGLKADGITEFRRSVLADLASGDRVHLDGNHGDSDVRLLTPSGPLVGLGLKYETVNSGQPVKLEIDFTWGKELDLYLKNQASQSATPTAP